ncbi:MAG: response regulator [Bacteroidia bacterium]
MKSPRVTLAVVDDHCAVREGCESILQNVSYIHKIETFATAREMIVQMRKKPFDFVLLDIQLKDEDGLEVCKELKREFKKLKVLMYSTYDSSLFIYDAYHSDADGYLCKGSGAQELKMALDIILLQNGRYFNADALDKILYHENIKNQQELTHREKDVTKLISKGKSDKEIANILHRSKATISTHRHNILQKIAGHKSIDIINFAINNGLHLFKKYQ